jgi:hypothetical protein
MDNFMYMSFAHILYSVFSILYSVDCCDTGYKLFTGVNVYPRSPTDE